MLNVLLGTGNKVLINVGLNHGHFLAVSMKIGYKADNAKMIQKNVRMFMAKHQPQTRYETENSRERIDELNSMHKCTYCVFCIIHCTQ